MKALLKKTLSAAATAAAVLFFVSCTSDLPPQVITANGDSYSEKEFESLKDAGLVDEMGNVIDTTLTRKVSSSSTATEAKSSGAKDFSSSAAASSASENASSTSGDVSSDSEPVESSSSEEEEDDEESSSSAAEESSSSYEAVFGSGVVGESIIAKDGVISIGTDAMVEVDDENKDALDAAKAALDEGKDLPDGFGDLGVETTFEDFNYEAFIENAFFCLTEDDSWLEISRSELAKNIPHFKNGADLGPLEGFAVRFADACKAVVSLGE